LPWKFRSHRLPGCKPRSSFKLIFVPADGIRLPFFRSGDLGTSPFFGQLSVRPISLTVRQRTTVPANKIGPARKYSVEQKLLTLNWRRLLCRTGNRPGWGWPVLAHRRCAPRSPRHGSYRRCYGQAWDWMAANPGQGASPHALVGPPGQSVLRRSARAAFFIAHPTSTAALYRASV
jgi:hypothetical protein